MTLPATADGPTTAGSLDAGAPVDRSSSTGRDASGTRVSKGTIAAWSCDPTVNGFTTMSDYVLDSSGRQAVEMGVDANGSVVWQHTNVWAGGTLLATYDGGSTTYGLHFYFNDPLGTRRVQTDANGVVEKSCSSLPYGDAETCAPTPTEHLFTGKERDTESGNDYFEARYYSSAMGRFMSPDWSAQEEPVPYAKLDNPQSLNLYSYVLNNPLGKADPDGHEWIDPSQLIQMAQQAAKNPYVQGVALLGAAAVAGPEVLAAAGEATTVTQGLGVGVAALGVTGTAVNGASDILGTATHTNVDSGTNMVTNVTNPVAATVGLATGSAEKGAQAADLATVVKAGVGLAQGKGVSNPAEVATSLAGAKSAVTDIANKVTSTISGAFAQTPSRPPPPAPPPPPSCSVAGACPK